MKISMNKLSLTILASSLLVQDAAANPRLRGRSLQQHPPAGPGAGAGGPGQNMDMWSLDQLATSYFESEGVFPSGQSVTDIAYMVSQNGHQTGPIANFQISVVGSSFQVGQATITQAQPYDYTPVTVSNPTSVMQPHTITNTKESSATFSATTTKGFSSTTTLSTSIDIADFFKADIQEQLQFSVSESQTQSTSYTQTWENTFTINTPPYTSIVATQYISQVTESVPFSVQVEIDLQNAESNVCVYGMGSFGATGCEPTVVGLVQEAGAPFTQGSNPNNVLYTAEGELSGMYGKAIYVAYASYPCPSNGCTVPASAQPSSVDYYLVNPDGSLTPINAIPGL